MEKLIDYFKKSIEEYYNKGFQEWLKLWRETQKEIDDVPF